jgi:hypothetical protein
MIHPMEQDALDTLTLIALVHRKLGVWAAEAFEPKLSKIE